MSIDGEVTYIHHTNLFAVIQPPPMETSAVASTTASASTTSTSSPPSPPTTTSVAAPPPPPPPSSSAPAPAPAPSSSAAPAPAASPASSSSSASSQSSSSSGSSAAIQGGSQWCMTYSPYTAAGTCKSQSDITADVASIASKGFSAIRIYSTDCHGLPYVGAAAAAHGLKLVLGIYISSTGIGAAEGQISDITTYFAGNYAQVEMVVVGNEAIFNNFCSGAALATFIAQVKSTLRGAGYAGPVTTTEPMDVLNDNLAALCPVIDVVGCNVHPFFNPQTTAAGAGAFVAAALTTLAGYCDGKPDVYNLETGWPHQGDCNGAACPGLQEQIVAVQGIHAAAGGKSAFFSFTDDLWKAEDSLGVEQAWGCGGLFG
ncbi:hypothetical protein MMC19_001984 [Ptychographa xylographoides]|nr:hypothetical protein [Ptychographa xylographoides]